ncbi:hypothetical protein CPAV1605_1236 [seawater metagenome]|uniref:Amine oxidase domain-containing protein n=1 Tax=seawater metagenome TaxID=1561972 RepID=A0A5E8CLZ2_9ZZZZ
MKQISIIGASLDGLLASILFAKKGYQVNIYEKKEYVGAKLINDFKPFICFKKDINNIFKLIEEELDQNIKYDFIDKMNIYLDPKNSFCHTSNLKKVLTDLKIFDKNIKNKILLLLTSYKELFDYDSKPSITAFIMQEMFGYDIRKNNKQLQGKIINNIEIQNIINSYGLIFGLTHESTINNHALLIYRSLTEGLIYIEGGYSSFISYLYTVAQKNGVNIHLNTNVQKVCYKNSKITHLRLDNNEKIQSDNYIITKSLTSTIQQILTGNEYLQDKLTNINKTTSSNIISFTLITNKLNLNQFSIFVENFHTVNKVSLQSKPSFFIEKKKISDDKDELKIFLINQSNQSLMIINKYIIDVLSQYGLTKIHDRKNDFIGLDDNKHLFSKLHSRHDIKDNFFSNLYFLNSDTQAFISLYGTFYNLSNLAASLSEGNLLNTRTILPKVQIIGASLEGMIASCYLAKEGIEVEIIEKESIYGGKFNNQNYKLKPILVFWVEQQKKILQEIGIDTTEIFKKLSPSYKIFFVDKEISITNNINDTINLFEKIELGAGKKLEKWLNIGEGYYNKLLKEEKIDIFTELKKNYIQQIEKYFKNDYLRIILKWHLIFMLNGNYLHSDTNKIINYTDLVLGHYILNKDLTKLVYNRSKELNVQYKFNENVEEILECKNNAIGVETNKNLYLSDHIINTCTSFQKNNKLDNKIESNFLVFRFLFNKAIIELSKINIILDHDPSIQIENQNSDQLNETPVLFINNFIINDNNNSEIFVYIPFSNDINSSRNFIAHYKKYILKRLNSILKINNINDLIIEEDVKVNKNAYVISHYFRQSSIFNQTIISDKLQKLTHIGSKESFMFSLVNSVMSGKKIASQLLSSLKNNI